MPGFKRFATLVADGDKGVRADVPGLAGGAVREVDVVVLELSSFQLEGIERLRPRVAALLKGDA